MGKTIIMEKTELELAQEVLTRAKAEKEQLYIDKFNELIKEMNDNGVKFEIKPQIIITAL